MRLLRSSLSAVLTLALVALTFWVAAPAMAAPGAAIRITEFAYGGKVAGAGGGDGEYAELTNVGDAPQDLTGWTYDSSAATAATGLSLSSLGTVAPGESVIVTDLSADEFRTDWGLQPTVKVLSNAKTHTLNGGPNSVHVYDDTAAEVDSVSYAAGFETAKGKSAWVDAAHVGARADTTGWTVSTAGDHESSWTSATGSIGSPGASTLGTKTPADVRTGQPGSAPEAPCDTEDAGTAPGTVPPDAGPWPGGQSPATIDAQCAWVTSLSGQDLSGLAFDPRNANVLYAVKNKSHVYRLVRAGAGWAKDTTNDWTDGKDLRFPGGTGLPDSEGLTVGPDGALYITTERDNAASGTPLDSILKFDPAAAGTTLVASDQWLLTSDLGFTSADANLGFEGVAYVPDSFLTASRFRTDAGALYDPASYPGKAVPGLFFGAVEKTGHLRAYVLNTDHTFVRVADVDTGMAGVMDASFDPDLGRIWAHCDNTCGNATALIEVGSDGHMALDHHYRTPTNLPNYNLEGFAVAPASTATNGTREVLWTDDGNRGGHSLWSGTIAVDLGLAQTATPTPTISGSPVLGHTLTANVGTWDPGVTTHYVWKDAAAVLASDGPLELSDPALVGRTITLEVTGTRAGFATTTRSVATTVTAAPLTAPVPVLRGTPKVGRTLSATAAFGPGSVHLAYTWLANGRVVAGAHGSTLRLAGAVAGARIVVRVTGTKPGYATATVSSRATGPVQRGTLTTTRPKIHGSAKVGKLLTAVRGAWSADGAAATVSYRWYADGKAVKGATTATLKLTRKLRGHKIAVRLTGSAVGYATAVQTSATTRRVR